MTTPFLDVSNKGYKISQPKQRECLRKQQPVRDKVHNQANNLPLLNLWLFLSANK